MPPPPFFSPPPLPVYVPLAHTPGLCCPAPTGPPSLSPFPLPPCRSCRRRTSRLCSASCGCGRPRAPWTWAGRFSRCLGPCRCPPASRSSRLHSPDSTRYAYTSIRVRAGDRVSARQGGSRLTEALGSSKDGPAAPFLSGFRDGPREAAAAAPTGIPLQEPLSLTNHIPALVASA